MKSIYLKGLALLALALTFGCSSDGGDSGGSQAVAVTTAAPQDISGLSVTLGGQVTSGQNHVTYVGVCYGTSANPTVNDHSEYANDNGDGNFSVAVTMPESNTLYHVRAFAYDNGNNCVYGGDMTFTSGTAITSQVPTDILPKSVLFRGRTEPSDNYDIDYRGYCFNTLPNPTISNQVASVSGGFGDFTVPMDGLTPNTNYYARSFFSSNGQIHYGAEVQFRTTGYFGPGGGYVIYDKGDSTSGWRYMEIYHLGINYGTSGYGAYFGCANTYTSGTYTDFGKGAENTQLIVSHCGSANCAARLCDNFSNNGQSDWFLPSRDEMVTITKAMESIDISMSEAWTSSDLNNDYAYTTYYSLSTYTWGYSTYGTKNSYYKVYPVRRY